MTKNKRTLEDSLIEDLGFMKEWALRHVLYTDFKTKQKIENTYKAVKDYFIKQKKLKYKNKEK